MFTWIKTIAPIAVAAVLALGAPSAEAATYFAPFGGSCDTSDVSANGGSSSDCFGTINDPAVAVNPNQDVFASSVPELIQNDPGLFGYNDWSVYGSATSGLGQQIDVTANADRTEGTWSVDPGAFDSVLRIVVVLTTGTRSAAYLFENPAAITGGTWDSSAFPALFGLNRLTDMIILTSGVIPVPLPAGALLLLTGLGAFGAMGRRKRNAAKAAAA